MDTKLNKCALYTYWLQLCIKVEINGSILTFLSNTFIFCNFSAFLVSQTCLFSVSLSCDKVSNQCKKFACVCAQNLLRETECVLFLSFRAEVFLVFWSLTLKLVKVDFSHRFLARRAFHFSIVNWLRKIVSAIICTLHDEEKVHALCVPNVFFLEKN